MAEGVSNTASIATEAIELTELPDTAGRTLEDQNGRGQEAPCMVCRKSKKIRKFNDLQPGDHIEMPMFCEKKSPMKHHAIVKEIQPKPEQEGDRNAAHIAQVMVIDVPSAGETFCERWVPFKSGPFKVRSHALRDKDKINCKKSTIKRVDYHRRRNTHEQTLDNAECYVSKDLERSYNGCVRNCEHFCVAMVNGEAINGELPNIEKATCLQSARCFWVSFHIILSILQYGFYIFNFYLYAVYARGNERYNHFFGNTSSNVFSFCYTGSDVRGFTTICDWITFAFLLVVYTIAYVCLLCIQYRKRTDVCNQCLISARIVFITKMMFFAAMEIFNIFLEHYLYLMIDAIDTSPALTLFFIFLLGLLELVLVLFIVPHVVVKHILIRKILTCCECRPACCNQCCSAVCCYPWDFDEDSYKYVIHYA